jgi:hypothetical protein
MAILLQTKGLCLGIQIFFIVHFKMKLSETHYLQYDIETVQWQEITVRNTLLNVHLQAFRVYSDTQWYLVISV